MRTRKTSDYSPTMKGSKAEQQAIQARREMLKMMETSNEPPHYPQNKWQRKMVKNAEGFILP